jgi:hypothetical protein
MSERVSNKASEAWRDHVLKQVVDFLETNRDSIIDRFEADNTHDLKREDIEQSDLLDFDVAVTLHRDKSSSFGLGFGFFKANIIRWISLQASRELQDLGAAAFPQQAWDSRSSSACLQIQRLYSSGASSWVAGRCSCMVNNRGQHSLQAALISVSERTTETIPSIPEALFCFFF